METNSSERMANLGERVKTKSLGEITVKEPSLEGILTTAKDIYKLIVSNSLDSSDVSGAWLVKLLANPELAVSIKSLLAVCTDKKPSDFDSIPITDLLKISAAFKKVIVWAEVKELFFQLVPPEVLQSLKSKLPGQ
jgi:hypothetical protein